jgi:hypothetical protein
MPAANETEFTSKNMVALENYPGIKVEVLVNGDAVQEYLDPEPVDGHVSRYIEVAAGDPFSVKLTVARGYPRFKALLRSDAMSYKVEIDGTWIDHKIVEKKCFPSRGTYTDAVDALKIRSGLIWQKRALTFSSTVLGISSFKSFPTFLY